MIVTAGGLVHLYEELGKYIKKRKCKSNILEKKAIAYIVNEKYFVTDRQQYKEKNFIEFANLINSGVITLNMFALFILDSIVKEKYLKLFEIKKDKFKNFTIFYSSNKIKEQVEFINNMIEESNQKSLFDRLNDDTNLYNVRDNQENRLYDLVKEGKINYLIYIDALEKGYFNVDMDKIENISFYNFMQIVKGTQKAKIKLK